MTNRFITRGISATRGCAVVGALSIGVACASPAASPWALYATPDGSAAGSSGGDGTGLGGSSSSGGSSGSGVADASGAVDGTARADGSAPVADARSGADVHDAAPLPPPADPCVEAGTCPPGAWINVTPQGISLDANTPSGNYGVMDVVADPVRPNELYAFICFQGVWKSTDYGLTWKKVDTGMNSSHLDTGKPWTAAIDPNPNRDPNTSPALYTAAGNADLLGVYKSTDGGVNWSNYTVANATVIKASGLPGLGDDVYSLDIDPYNSNHLLAGFHGYPGISESKDGAQTWSTIAVPAGIGNSLYVWFINTGAANTTAGTWLTMAQAFDTGGGLWRTANGGGMWTQVQSVLVHQHGAAQIYQSGANVYAAGLTDNPNTYGVWRSTDYGQTWAAANGNGVPQNAVFGTPSYVYAMNFPGDVNPGSQHLQRSPATDGMAWSDWPPVAPQGMTNGVKRAAVTFDGKHHVIVTGSWLVGIWRYVEP
jgi:hypothetical protein